MQTFLPFFCNVRHNSLLENKIEQLKIKLQSLVKWTSIETKQVRSKQNTN